MRKSIFIFMIMIFMISCNQSEKLSEEQMKQIVQEQASKFQQGVQKKDSALIVSLYSDEALYLQPFRPIVKGKELVAKEWSHFLNFTAYDLILETETVRGNKDIIYETGVGTTFFVKHSGDSAQLKYNFVNVWKLQKDGSYKLDIDCYTPLSQ